VDNRSMDVPTITGVVKGGMIVPDRPLAEGTYVEMRIPNAPRELVLGGALGSHRADFHANDRRRQRGLRPARG
jgi:hypothetical protein